MRVDYKKELNKEQYEAVTHICGPLCIVAGAGSGKTRVLIYRAMYMIEKGISPEYILLLTFTNKAAAEMKSRAMSMLDESCARINACTFHSFCALLMRKFAHKLGLSNGFTIINASDVVSALDLVKSQCGYSKLRGFPGGKAIAGYISKSVNMQRPLSDFLYDSGRILAETYTDEIHIVAEKYKKYKNERNLMDYDDLLFYCNELVKKFPDVRDVIAARFPFVMVDEYQDTNSLQEDFLFTLMEKTRNLCVVGDDYQSIYAFRGAEVQNIIAFLQKMQGTRVVTLHRNYRSDQRILDLANNVMKDHACEGIYKEMISNHNDGIKPVVVHVEGPNEERDAVVDIIKELMNKGIRKKEIAIIARASNWANAIEAKLMTDKIPYRKFGGLKFMEKAHIQDVLAFLRIMVNAHDELAFFRILQLYPGVGQAFAQKISEKVHADGYDGIRDKSFSRRKFYGELLGLYDVIKSWKELELHELIRVVAEYRHDLCERVINDMKVQDVSEIDEKLEANDETRVDFESLYIMAEEYKTTTAFLDALALDATMQNDDDDTVNVTTVHSAKGLEYDAVIILDCVDGRFPRNTISEAGSPDEQEELRCFYVAMTRAKKRLYMMVPSFTAGYGSWNPCSKSHFLMDEEEYYDVDESHSMLGLFDTDEFF